MQSTDSFLGEFTRTVHIGPWHCQGREQERISGVVTTAITAGQRSFPSFVRGTRFLRIGQFIHDHAEVVENKMEFRRGQNGTDAVLRLEAVHGICYAISPRRPDH